ncbi:MAG: diguanylate cyclase [Spirochaetaceae bacterium]|nr:MAG: diguanylate cyclase [Spirochaetaceae bacterium]
MNHKRAAADTGSALTDSGQRLVCIAIADPAAAADLSDQLGFFGFTTRIAAHWSDLPSVVDTTRTAVVILEAEALERDSKYATAMRDLKDSRPESVFLIYISSSDSFELRLISVRSGGDAFLLRPLEIARLIDKIDSLMGSQDREPYHVLVVNDNPDEVSNYAHILQSDDMITSVVSDPRHLFPVLIEAKPELILIDMHMAGWNGIELTRLIRQQETFIGVPIIFVSSEKDIEKRLEAIGYGGDDFVSKPVVPRYLNALLRLRAARTRHMRFFMERDSLTGLLNHSNLREKLGAELKRAERIGNSLCFCMIDIDHFKSVNDTYGHLTGDRVLKSLARLLHDRLRKTDVVGRYGGEEFGVALFDTGLQQAEKIMNEIRDSFSQIRQQFQGKEFYVSLSCGIGSYPEYRTVGDLIEAADRALYEAKERGRNRVTVA